MKPWLKGAVTEHTNLGPENAAPRLTQVSEQKHLDFHVNGSYSRYLTSFKPADFISLTGFFFIHYKAAIKTEQKICEPLPRR